MFGLSPGMAAQIQRVLFDTTVTVYGEGAGGDFTQSLQGNLRARFVLVNQQPAATGADRTELAGLRELWWDPTYVMPEHCQVADAAGVRWNPQAGTFALISEGASVYRRCDVVRAA